MKISNMDPDLGTEYGFRPLAALVRAWVNGFLPMMRAGKLLGGKMKKRVVAGLISSSLALSLSPVVALATNELSDTGAAGFPDVIR